MEAALAALAKGGSAAVGDDGNEEEAEAVVDGAAEQEADDSNKKPAAVKRVRLTLRYTNDDPSAKKGVEEFQIICSFVSSEEDITAAAELSFSCVPPRKHTTAYVPHSSLHCVTLPAQNADPSDEESVRCICKEQGRRTSEWRAMARLATMVAVLQIRFSVPLPNGRIINALF